MRCWHQDLIPKLCRNHLLGMWRECNGMYKIITENKKGYRQHPAVKEFEHCPEELLIRLEFTRNEMLKRGYHPKQITTSPYYVLAAYMGGRKPKEWQTLEQQIEILKGKNCECKLDSIGGEK